MKKKNLLASLATMAVLVFGTLPALADIAPSGGCSTAPHGGDSALAGLMIGVGAVAFAASRRRKNSQH